jgi:hypothetical protein
MTIRNWITATYGDQICVELKLGHFEKYIRNTCEVLKHDAGEGWRRAAGLTT